MENKRAEAFNKLNPKNLKSDIENRDFFLSHICLFGIKNKWN